MTQTYDVIVIGVGGMGSATVYELAKRGKKVLGLEKFDVPHEMGSSHGHTRIIRLAYYEDPTYVPLLRRAYELWRDTQTAAGETLLHTTGSIDAGPADDAVFTGSLESCEIHNLPHEVLTGAELAQRFPGYQLPSDYRALLQPEGGFLTPERCIVSHVRLAQEKGVVVHGREAVIGWEPTANGVRVRTSKATYEAEKLVITAGAWAGKLVPELRDEAVPERQVLIWMQPKKPDLFTPERFPVFNLKVPEGRFYGFPVYSIPGFKFGLYHHLDETVDPDTYDREAITDRDEEVLRDFGEKYFPDGAGATMTLRACMFTNSTDEHFVLDLHPDYPQVSFAAGFSGHGFKFASVIGEIMAELALDGDTRHDISLLRYGRFSKQAV